MPLDEFKKNSVNFTNTHCQRRGLNVLRHRQRRRFIIDLWRTNRSRKFAYECQGIKFCSLRPVARQLPGRKKDNNPRRNNARAVQAMASASEKAFGQTTFVLVGGYDFAANILEHSGKFAPAIIYKQREIAA